MYNHKLITAFVALIFIPAAAMAIGKRIDYVAPEHIFHDNPIFETTQQASSVLAQNDKESPEKSEKAESESENSESDAAADDDKKPSETESTPQKPFVPSEQIAGEQAVDFPADI